MRINKPQLFNGQYLASNDAILSAFFGAGKFLPNQQTFVPSADAKIVSSLIDWSVVDADFISGKVNGSNIKISDATDAATIKTYIDNAVTSVRTYEVAGDTYVSAAKTEADGNVKYTLTTDTAAIANAISGSVIDAADINIAKSNESDLIYTLMVNGKAVSTINIPEDQFLKSGVYDSDKRALVLTFNIDKDGEPGIDTVEIPVSGLIKEFTAGSGIVLNDTVFSGVVDEASESFLTVGADGFKLAGVQDAIDTASGAALTDAKAYSDLVSGAAYNQIVVTSGAIIDYVDVASGVLVGDISDALTSAKAYTDEVSGNLDTAIKAAAASAASAAQDAANALTSAKAYTDEVSAEIIGTESAVSGDLNLYGVKAYVNAKTAGIATDAALGELQSKVTEVSGKVTNLESNKVSVAEKGIYNWSDFEITPEGGTAVSGLYVDAEGQTKFWNGTDFVATSEEVVDTFEGAADDSIPSVAAVSAFVDAKAEAVADVAAEAVAEVKTAVETAVTMVTSSFTFGNVTSATVSGRVIAVYDNAGVCYPTITYTGSEATKDVVATISADAADAAYTVVYTKFVEVAAE